MTTGDEDTWTQRLDRMMADAESVAARKVEEARREEHEEWRKLLEERVQRAASGASVPIDAGEAEQWLTLLYGGAWSADQPTQARRRAWAAIPARTDTDDDGREVWPLDTVKDWTVRILFDVGADLRKMNDAAANGRPRSKRGVVRRRYYTTWPKLVSRRIFGRVPRTFYYSASKIELDALAFDSDLAWAVDQVLRETERLAHHVVAYIKGEYVPINMPIGGVVGACVETFSEAESTTARGRAIFDLWRSMGLESASAPMNQATERASAAFVVRRDWTPQAWAKTRDSIERIADCIDDKGISDALRRHANVYARMIDDARKSAIRRGDGRTTKRLK